jgi:molybdopterin-binding protein
MIQSNQKTSLLVPYQLPKFIGEDPNYANFVLFIQAYYEWMEQNGNTLDFTKSLLTYMDVDTTTTEFLDYFVNDFMSYFPQDILADKSKVIKIAKQLYQSKGTPASYQFLFRVLFNSDFDYYVTGDSVLKASAGTWYVPRSVRLDTVDENFLAINNLRLFGLSSKSIATVENSVLSGSKTEVFISNIERLFQSGEDVIVVDSNNQPVYFKNGKQVPAGTANAETLTAKIVGQISQITINPNYRGTLYQPGDPVIVYGGLNPNTAKPVGAIAEVGTVTSGSIQNILVTNGGYGYTNFPNTLINITNATGANAVVGSLNPSANSLSNITYFSIDSIATKLGITIGNTAYDFANLSSANANTTLANALTFLSFSTYPISTVTLLNGGGAISQPPVVTAIAREQTDNPDTSNAYAFISSLGILAPIQIINGGNGYQNNDTIVITGGGGIGAHANVLSVNSTGAIQSVGYVYPNPDNPHHYPLGGMGYVASQTPNVTVVSANNQAANAVLSIPGILGSGATFSTVTNRVGSVTTINIINPGEDYVSAPNVSLVVQDIVVSNVTIANLPQTGDIAYQGSNVYTALYKSTVNNVTLLVPNADPTQSLYNLRVFNYTSQPNPGQKINISGKNIHMVTQNVAYNEYYNSYGVRNYGDGKALATASFLNGLVIGQGQYLNSSGQPSSYDVLQSSTYNNYTYEITVQKEIAKYREVLLNLLHPSGMQVLGRYALNANDKFDTTVTEALFQGVPLPHYTGTNASGVSMSANFSSFASNTVTFTNLAGADIASFIFSNQVGYANSIIQIETPHGPNVRSEVWGITAAFEDLSLDIGSEDLAAESGAEDLLTENAYVNLKESYWLTFPNVAVVTANSGSNTINIVTLTGSYDIINDGAYSNTMYPLMDIVYAGDLVQVNNTVYTVSSVNYTGGTITVANNFTSNANGFLSVNRTLTASDGEVVIYGPLGLAYTPELTTEDGQLLITEDGNILILD